MHRLSLQILLLTVLSLNIYSSEDDILGKLSGLGKAEEVEQITYKPIRFKIDDYDYGQKMFYGVLLENSIIQSLDGSKKYSLNTDTNMRFKEIKNDDRFTYIVNKEGIPQFVCRTNDLKKIDYIVNMRPKHIPFKKENIEYNKINLDQTLLLNMMLSYGQHNFVFDELATPQQSVSLNLETGFKNQSLLPFMITTSVTKLSNAIIEWNFVTFGLRLYYKSKLSASKNFMIYLEAQRAIWDSAILQKNNVSIDLNRYILGANYNTHGWILGAELFNERSYFPGNVNLSSYGIESNDTFHTGFALRIGKEFEINL